MQMETLPPKYLKPIFMTGKNVVIRKDAITLTVKVEQGGSSSFAAGGEAFSTGTTSFTTGTEAFTTGAESYAAGGETFAAGASAESYAQGGADFGSAGADFGAAGADFGTTGAEFSAGTNFGASGAEFGAAGAEFSAGGEFGGASMGAEFGGVSAGAGAGDLGDFQLLRRGAGISQNEQNTIAKSAKTVIDQGLLPLSNKTATAVKQNLGGDWLVIVYPSGKPIDFNMTCVQGNDYLYFRMGGNDYQVCRLT